VIALETEAQGTTQGRDEAASNVVRLPRDWLGPREELVPFGPAADRAEAAARAAAEAHVIEISPRPETTDPSGTDAADCTQDDFWGGDLEAIPKPLLGPRPAELDIADPPEPSVREPAAAVAPGPAVFEMPRKRTRRRRRPSPGSVPRLVRGRLAAVGGGLVRGRIAAVGGGLVRGRIAAVGGGLAAAALAASVVGASLNNSGPGTSARQSPRVPTLASAAPALVLPARLDLLPHRVARARMIATATHRSRTRVHHSSAPPAGTPTFVKVSTLSHSTSTSSSGSASASASAPVVTRQPTSTSTSTASSAAKSTSVSATSARKARSGPVGQGAPFGPGQLG
jgi:hypothetical protein